MVRRSTATLADGAHVTFSHRAGFPGCFRGARPLAPIACGSSLSGFPHPSPPVVGFSSRFARPKGVSGVHRQCAAAALVHSFPSSTYGSAFVSNSTTDTSSNTSRVSLKIRPGISTRTGAVTDGRSCKTSTFASLFEELRARNPEANLIPIYKRIMGDQLTPIVAYKKLGDAASAEHSFLFESVNNGTQQGRYSFVGARPLVEIVARGRDVELRATPHSHHRDPGLLSTLMSGAMVDGGSGSDGSQDLADAQYSSSSNSGQSETQVCRFQAEDPLVIPERVSSAWRVPTDYQGIFDDFPSDVFTGGWVGYCGYDTVRYVYKDKLPFEDAPTDDRGVPDMHLALYQDTVLFDHATKLAYVVCWIDTRTSTLDEGTERLEELLKVLQDPGPAGLSYGNVDMSLQKKSPKPTTSNFTKKEFMDAIDATKEHILAGDVFQLVLSQRFERTTRADPFSVYRALRVVNPSPYMAYIRTNDATIVSSSPEILCRVGVVGNANAAISNGGPLVSTEAKGPTATQTEGTQRHTNKRRIVTNRPLAGTRRRGVDEEEDGALEEDLLQDEKEIAEHVMLVDLGRNDVGKVSKQGTVVVEKLMEIERYSHVMHISSTVTGELRDDLSCWDALRAALPAGTVSGAPKVRAMQILDELEKSKRGPYGGGFGWAAFGGAMDMALSLRTMVVLPSKDDNEIVEGKEKEYVCHLQAGAGVVMDSVPESEYEETVNKAAALGRAIDLAEDALL
jgi:anthranilate synthase component 1